MLRDNQVSIHTDPYRSIPIISVSFAPTAHGIYHKPVFASIMLVKMSPLYIIADRRWNKFYCHTLTVILQLDVIIISDLRDLETH